MRIVLADRQRILLDALAAALIDHGHTVVATHVTASELVDSVRRLEPDMCIADLSGGDLGGVETIAVISGLASRTKVVVLTLDRHPRTMTAALEAGASGFIHKSRSFEALLSAIDRVADGEVVVEGVIRGAAPLPTPPHGAAAVTGLTVRERQCLELLADGLSTTEMARTLGVSATTVRTHVQAIFNKLNVHSRLAAAALLARSRPPAYAAFQDATPSRSRSLG